MQFYVLFSLVHVLFGFVCTVCSRSLGENVFCGRLMESR